MNALVNKILLAGDKVMPDMHLKQSGFTYSAQGPFTKQKKKNKKIKETGNSRDTYQNKLDKVCFQHGIAYGGFKDLNRRKLLIKLLRALHKK